MVSITLVTYNSELHLVECLESALRQDYSPLEVLVVDNASTDRTQEILQQYASRVRLLLNDENTGFAAGQNQAIRAAAGNWIFCLNPDVCLTASFIGELVKRGARDGSIGSLCGKLLRWDQDQDKDTRIVDSTGIYFVPSLRHFDRGAGEPDTGQFEQSQFVFGATGAAALYRRKMITDISITDISITDISENEEFFDEDFFAYREDADVAWRAQLLGWRCLYVPEAMAKHVRRVTPERFKELPHVINWHSVKNRFLMRAKNISWGLYTRVLLPATFRDLQVLGYALLVDRRFISAFTFLWRNRQRIAAKRRWIQSRRRVSDKELRRWFANSPAAFPVQDRD